MKQRLDVALTVSGLVRSRSQAESWIKLGKVTVDGAVVIKPGYFVGDNSSVALTATEQYVSRAGLKLASVARAFTIRFSGKDVLDVGSSTGGFTDYALQHGAQKVYAVDVGTDQLHPSLRADPRIELHEKTDIRDYVPVQVPDIIVIDVSFISVQRILPHIAEIAGCQTAIYVMVKPQFEAAHNQLTRSGIVRNDTVRRTILREFEIWARRYFVVLGKADSGVAGAHGNKERFYWLKKDTKIKR